MNRPSRPPISVADAEQALYLDFEGLMGEVPCMLGVRFGRRGVAERAVVPPPREVLGPFPRPVVHFFLFV